MQKKKTHQLSPEVKTKGIITLWTIGEHETFKRAEKKRNTFKVSIAKGITGDNASLTLEPDAPIVCQCSEATRVLPNRSEATVRVLRLP